MQLRADLDLTTAAGKCIADAAEGGVGNIRRRRPETRRVRQVRCIAPELQLDPLGERDALQQARVQLEVMRPQEEVARQIAELPGARRRKLRALCRIEVPLQA